MCSGVLRFRQKIKVKFSAGGNETEISFVLVEKITESI